jgi:hypothetical protein
MFKITLLSIGLGLLVLCYWSLKRFTTKSHREVILGMWQITKAAKNQIPFVCNQPMGITFSDHTFMISHSVDDKFPSTGTYRIVRIDLETFNLILDEKLTFKVIQVNSFQLKLDCIQRTGPSKFKEDEEWELIALKLL